MGDWNSVFGNTGFDTNSVEPSASYDAIPAGWYTAQIDSAEICKTKAGTGQYLKMKFTVLGGDFGNRVVFENINLSNPNATAVEIGMRALAGLGQACGLMAIGDTTDLLSKMCQIRVKIEAAKGEHEASNSVSAYKPVDGADTGKAGGASAAAQAKQTPIAEPKPLAAQDAQAAQQTTVVDAPKKMPWEK